MAVLVIFRASGDPADLLSRYERTLAGATALASARPEAHFCVPTESGIMIVDVWNSRAELQRAVIDNKAFQAKWDEAGWPEEAVEIFEVHNSEWPQ
jgi:hypothetical protein